MTIDTTQRLAVSALAPCPVCGGSGELPVLDINMLHHKDVACPECEGFGTTEQDLNRAQAVMHDTMREPKSSGADYLPSPNPGFGEKV